MNPDIRFIQRLEHFEQTCALLNEAIQINDFGLSERDIKTLTTIVSRYTHPSNVRVFGSRAKGNHKPGSDIDLALSDPSISLSDIANIRNDLEESSLPYCIDIVDMNTLADHTIRGHIERVGKTLSYNP